MESKGWHGGLPPYRGSTVGRRLSFNTYFRIKLESHLEIISWRKLDNSETEGQDRPAVSPTRGTWPPSPLLPNRWGLEHLGPEEDAEGALGWLGEGKRPLVTVDGCGIIAFQTRKAKP